MDEVANIANKLRVAYTQAIGPSSNTIGGLKIMLDSFDKDLVEFAEAVERDVIRGASAERQPDVLISGAQ